MMTERKTTRHTTWMAFGLLLIMFFAQGNQIAHELTEPHSIDQSCEWCGHSKGSDDELLSQCHDESHHNFSVAEEFSHYSYINGLNHYQRPYLRGPPA